MAGSKGKARKGTGGHGRKRLEGKGPTPKASDRTYHKAYRERIAAEKEATHREGVAKRVAAKEKYRPHTTATGNEVIYGRNPVLEAAAARVPFRRLFVSSQVMKDQRLSQIVEKAAASGVELRDYSPADLDRLTGGGAHQGVAAEIARYEYAEVMDLWDRAVARRERAGAGTVGDTAGTGDGAGTAPAASTGANPATAQPPLFIALDQVTDPHNLGAVLRSAAAFGADGVIVPEHRSAPVNAAVWKVSAGAAAIVPVAQAGNLVRALQGLKAVGAFVIGLDGGGDVALPQLALTDVPLVVVTGSEGKGLSRLVRENCDQIVSIPIDARMESLNAAVATGIALYQVAVARGVGAGLAGAAEQAGAGREAVAK